MGDWINATVSPPGPVVPHHSTVINQGGLGAWTGDSATFTVMIPDVTAGVHLAVMTGEYTMPGGGGGGGGGTPPTYTWASSPESVGRGEAN